MISKETERSARLSDYYYVLVKHKWLIINSLIVSIALAWGYNIQSKPVYQSSATLVMGKEQLRTPITGQTLLYEGVISQSLAFNTHFKLITSRSVLEQVIRKVELDQAENKLTLTARSWKQLLSLFKSNILLLFGGEDPSANRQTTIADLARILKKKIRISRVKDTLLLRITVEDHDPAMARDIANAVAESYIEFNMSTDLSASSNTQDWMADQLEDMKKKLEEAEAEFIAYKQEEKVLFSMEGKQDLLSQEISKIKGAYSEARNRRIEIETILSELKRPSLAHAELVHVRSVINNPVIDALYRELPTLEVERSNLSKVYKTKHPKMIQIQARIDDTRQKLREELGKEIENLKSERSLLIAREKALEKKISDFEKDVFEIDKKNLNYTILERNVQNYQRLYDTLLSRVKEFNIFGDSYSADVQIAETAALPIRPIRPDKKRNLTYGALLGLMVGLVVSFLWEFLDRSLRTEEDVERYLGLPVLSVIPVADSEKRNSEGKESGTANGA